MKLDPLTPLHPNEAIEIIGNNSRPEWLIENYADENETRESWRLSITDKKQFTYWYQVFDKHFPSLDHLIKAMYENSLPVATMPITISTVEYEDTL